MTSDLPRVTHFGGCQSQDSNSALSNCIICALCPSTGLPAVSLLGGVLSCWPVLSLGHSLEWPSSDPGLPWGSDGKESACKVKDVDLIPRSRRPSGEGNGIPFQYSCLEDPVDRGAWWATVHGVTESWTGLSKLHTVIQWKHPDVSRLQYPWKHLLVHANLVWFSKTWECNSGQRKQIESL